MALGLEVVMLPRVAPRHGARTVPVKGQEEVPGLAPQIQARIYVTGVRSPAHEDRPWGCSPWDVKEDQALGFQVLNLGGQVCPITLETTQGCSGCCKGEPGPSYSLRKRWPPLPPLLSTVSIFQDGKLMLPETYSLPNPDICRLPKDIPHASTAHPLPGPEHPGTLTTSLTCFAKSLELPVRKSEKAVCQGKRQS